MDEAALGRARIAQEIEPSLGVVEVDAWGSLLDVRLDADRVRSADPAAVGDRIRRAITAAEARAAQLVEEYLRRSQ